MGQTMHLMLIERTSYGEQSMDLVEGVAGHSCSDAVERLLSVGLSVRH